MQVPATDLTMMLSDMFVVLRIIDESTLNRKEVTRCFD